jgi:hypothetical protein
MVSYELFAKLFDDQTIINPISTSQIVGLQACYEPAAPSFTFLLLFSFWPLWGLNAELQALYLPGECLPREPRLQPGHSCILHLKGQVGKTIIFFHPVILPLKIPD